MFMFGAGRLWGIPSDGSTPVEFGVLQDVSVSMSWDKKELYGSLQFPQKVVRGKGKIDGKAAFAQINALGFNLLLGMGTLTANAQNGITTTNSTVPAGTPYTVTANPINKVNLGVLDVSNPLIAKPMTLVTAAPATGQYQYNQATGVYTFAAVDAGKAIQYTQFDDSAVGGTTLQLPNPVIGTAPVFKTIFNGTLDGKAMTLALNCCMTTKFDMAFKQEDFLIPQFDFSAFADSSGNPGEITFGE